MGRRTSDRRAEGSRPRRRSPGASAARRHAGIDAAGHGDDDARLVRRIGRSRAFIADSVGRPGAPGRPARRAVYSRCKLRWNRHPADPADDAAASARPRPAREGMPRIFLRPHKSLADRSPGSCLLYGSRGARAWLSGRRIGWRRRGARRPRARPTCRVRPRRPGRASRRPSRRPRSRSRRPRNPRDRAASPDRKAAAHAPSPSTQRPRDREQGPHPGHPEIRRRQAGGFHRQARDGFHREARGGVLRSDGGGLEADTGQGETDDTAMAGDTVNDTADKSDAEKAAAREGRPAGCGRRSNPFRHETH